MTRPAPIVGRAPGPRGRLVFGSLRDVQRDPLGLLTSAHATFGDVVRFRYLGPRAWHLFAHPAHVEEILLVRHQEFVKGVFARVIDVVTPGGLATAEGAEWVRQRRLLQPGFSPARIEGLIATIVDEVEEVISAWREPARRGDAVDLSAGMMRLSLRTAGRTLFGADLGGREADVERYVQLALEQLDRRVRHPLSPLPFLPTPSWMAYRAAARQVDALVAATIESRRRAGTEGPDLLGALLGARDAETGAPLDDGHVRNQVKTLLISSYETTARSLAWMLHRVARAPEVAERVRAEVRAVVGDGAPTYADLKRLTFTRQVVDETLRLYPPTFWLGRQALRACEVGGCAIPKGGVICISPYVTHRHPAFWARPDTFDPDHFEPAGVSARPRGAYLPFGLGPRYCVGQPLALAEMMAALAMAVQRWTLAPFDTAPVLPEARGTLRPSGPLLLRVAPTPSWRGA